MAAPRLARQALTPRHALLALAIVAVWLGKPLPPWPLTAAALILGGRALNVLWPRFARLWLVSPEA